MITVKPNGKTFGLRSTYKKSRRGVLGTEGSQQVWPNDNDMAIATFEAVKVNPEVSSDDFVLDFPEGVRVDDHIDSVSYVVGRELDRESMTREFMRRHRIDSQQPPA
jgi:hypothetical protein